MPEIYTQRDRLIESFQHGELDISKLAPQDYLHTLDPKLEGRDKYMPKGSTRADYWILTHGDPLRSTDAALTAAGLAGDVLWYELKVDHIKLACTAAVHYDDFLMGYGEAPTLPEALALAVIDYLDKKGDDDGED